MKVGDYFKIETPRQTEIEVIYEAVVLSQGSEWVSARVVHPQHLADKLKAEGVFKIHLPTLEIKVIGNPDSKPTLKAIYG